LKGHTFLVFYPHTFHDVHIKINGGNYPLGRCTK